MFFSSSQKTSSDTNFNYQDFVNTFLNTKGNNGSEFDYEGFVNSLLKPQEKSSSGSASDTPSDGTKMDIFDS